MALVGAQVTFLTHAQTFGDAPARDVGVVAPDSDSQGATLTEQRFDRGRRGFTDEALPHMGFIAEVADKIAGQIGIADTDIDLPDENAVLATESTKEGSPTGLRFHVEIANGGGGVSFRRDLHRRIVSLMA
ncbi:hypothetical protein M4J40_22110 [Pleomorphomonas sp. NRK JP5]|nr:hypothetical protein [Pleomorphomonas sp. JP5]MCM5560373.1 hypothetical protein [Pleomorphomonas sp. JP5]